MIAASNQMLLLMAAAYRIPVVMVVVQYPNPLNSVQQGSQLILEGITDIDISRNEEMTSDTMDLTIIAPDSRYSPLQGQNAYAFHGSS